MDNTATVNGLQHLLSKYFAPSTSAACWAAQATRDAEKQSLVDAIHTIQQQSARIAELEAENVTLANRCRYLESLFPQTLITPIDWRQSG